MFRAYSSAIFLCIVSLCVCSRQLKAQSAASQSRLDAVKAVLADFNRQKELVRKQEELLKQNAQDFSEIEVEMKRVFDAAQVTRFTRAVSQVANNQIIQNADPGNPASSQPVLQTANAIDIMKANLELMQLSSTQMALAQKRIECMQNSVQLMAARNGMLAGLMDFQEKLWEFADVSGIYSDEDNRSILSAFNSIKDEDTPAVLVRGLLRLRLEELDLAKDDLDLVVAQANLCTPVALAARGQVLEKQKTIKKSRSDFAMAKKLGNENLYVQWLLGNFAAADGEWKLAENYFQKALKAKKFEQPLHRSLALALFERNKSRKSSMKECLEHAEVASRLGTGKDWLSDAVYAAALSVSGETDSAKIQIESALASCPREAKEGCEAIASAIQNKSKPDTSVFWMN